MNQTASERKARNVLAPWSKQAAVNTPTFVRGEGSWLIDEAGKRYLDLSAGLVAVNMGHTHPKITAAITEQAQKVAYVPPSLVNDVRCELADLLSELSPWDEGGRTFFTTGGGEANEDAIKMARMITGRSKILAAYRSFHGSAPGAGSLTGEDRRWANEPGLPGIAHFFAPYPYNSPFDTDDPAEEVSRALQHLEQVITFEGPANIAALFIEPVVGSNGVITYPEGYLQGVRDLTEKHGIILVFDEVMTGFGRLGGWFGATVFGVTPDMITFAKGVACAYVPLGGVPVREEIAAHLHDVPLMCGHTYAGHPLNMAAGVANIKAMRDEGVLTRALVLEDRIRSGLEDIASRHPVIGDVRGTGAMYGIELVRNRDTREPLVPWYGGENSPMAQLVGALRKEGVYAFGRYNLLMITPPLVIRDDELEFGLKGLEAALSKVEGGWNLD